MTSLCEANTRPPILVAIGGRHVPVFPPKRKGIHTYGSYAVRCCKRSMSAELMNADTTKSKGRFRSILFREPNATEKTFLRAKYPNLSEVQMAEPVAGLSHVLTGEGALLRCTLRLLRRSHGPSRRPGRRRLHLRPVASGGNRGRLLQRFSETLTTRFIYNRRQSARTSGGPPHAGPSASRRSLRVRSACGGGFGRPWSGWQPQGRRPWGWLAVGGQARPCASQDHPQAALEAATRKRVAVMRIGSVYSRNPLRDHRHRIPAAPVVATTRNLSTRR